MKIAVLADIHGNLPALQAVTEHIEQWAPDTVVVNGDVVNRGPSSVACWDFVQERRENSGWLLTAGNHEAYVVSWEELKQARNPLHAKIGQSTGWTHKQLGERVREMEALSDCLEVPATNGTTVRATHGSMQGRRDGIYPHTAERELAGKVTPAPDVFCTAHTHKPLLRCWRGTLIVNSGSAGTSFDGDPRISYAQLMRTNGQWQAEIVRLPYDRRQAALDFVSSGYFEGGGPLVEIFYREWHQARPLINRWAQQYEESVLAGVISLADSVRDFLAEHG